MSVTLRINTQNSNMNIRNVDPQLRISGQDGNFELKKHKGNFRIRQKSDEVEIDTYKAYKQLNLESPQDLAKTQANKAKRKASENISNHVRDGEALMKIENKGNPILDIAEKNAFKKDNVELNVTYFPEEPIEIRVKKGYLNVEAEVDKVEVKSSQNLKIDVKPGGVYTTIDNYPKVDIEVLGEIYDSKA